MPVQTLKWQDNALVLLDQTRLPEEVLYETCSDVETVAQAIEILMVRGAPAIGLAAAYGVVIGAQEAIDCAPAEFRRRVEASIDRLARTRPTAVNLFWALDQMRALLSTHPDSGNQTIRDAFLATADRLFEEDRRICRQMGRNGAELLRDGSQVITHCNAGGLATADYGTALGVIYAAQEAGKNVAVFADETRPLLQGSRLTAWELMQNGVDVKVICDNMAASVLRSETIDCCIVGADRIARNGDVANKIGTYGLAILAREHGVPFYVAAPVSTLDISLASGEEIPIEERDPAEIRAGMGKVTAPDDVPVYNPAFDITPNELVTAIISEKGVVHAPFEPTLCTWVET
ncbi:MAG TPA: S-methyl-5-thioribose-1-phosphate isomerase [Candidatus Latescibacteria bacterium]|nr:S-methyl-5-thioribose-1-phosphate isomerase [Candidatus Handelsmanbacteria bacterium]HIL08488.1 S-methyl-5-thioribose-1-phosphate isomerase [Candidatus Latescibacterota bacterium]